MQYPRILSNNKGFSLLLIVVLFVTVGVAVYGAISLFVKLQQTDQGTTVTTRLTDIHDALKTYYRGHADLPHASPVPVADLGLNNNDKFDPWGQELFYDNATETAWGGINKINIEGLNVDGQKVGAVLISGGPNQARETTIDSGTTPPTYALPSGSDDIILGVNVLAEAKEIAQEQMDVIRHKLWAFAISASPGTSPPASFLSDYGLPANFGYDPWGNHYIMGTNGVSSTDGSFLPVLTKTDASGNAPTTLAVAGSGFNGANPGDTSVDLGGGGAFTGQLNDGVTVTTSDSVSGSALSFDGSSDSSMTVSTTGTTNNISRNTLSIAWWMNAVQEQTYHVIFMDRDTYDGNDGVEIWLEGEGLRVRGSGTTILSSSTNDFADEWVFVTVVFNGTSASIYRNGQLNATGTVQAVSSTSHEFIVGGYGDGSSLNFKGGMDELAIYNVALDQCQVNDIYIENFSASRNPGHCSVAYFPFNGDAIDESANSNDGVLKPTAATGPTWTSDSSTCSNRAYSFDGTNDYIDIGNDSTLEITDAITVAAWVKTTQTGAHKQLVTKNTTGGAFAYYLSLNNGIPNVYLGGISTPGWHSGNTAVNDGAWHHVAFTYDKTTGKVIIYVDGAVDNTISGLNGPINANSGASVWFGDRSDYTIYRYAGAIDDVVIFNWALDGSEIGRIKGGLNARSSCPSSTPGGTTTPLATWDFDEGTSNTVGVAPYLGTITGATWTKSTAGGLNTYDGFGESDNFREALSFDGTGDYITITAHDLTSSNTTISWWMNATQSAQYHILFMNRAAYNGTTGVEIWLENNQLQVRGSGTTILSSLATFTNEWVFASVVFDGSTAYIYKNGVLDRSGTVNAVSASTHDFIIGGYGDGTTYNYNGIMDQLAIYNSSLIANDIKALYDSAAVAHLRLNGNTNDSSPQGNNGTFNGTVSWQTDRFGTASQALTFDQANEYVSIATDSSLEITNAITIAAWVNTSESGPYKQLVTNDNYYLSLNNGVPNVYLKGTDNQWHSGITSVSNGIWRQVVFTYDKSTGELIIYVDGNEDKKITGLNGTIATSGSSVIIGHRLDLSGYSFNGAIDDVAIWPSALNATEISELAADK